jgi:hypothetical protein
LLENFSNGALDWQPDPVRRVVFSRWQGEFGGAELIKLLQRVWAERPELAAYNVLHDQRDFTGTIEHHFYPRLMQGWAAFCGGPTARNRTALVNGSALKFLEVKLLGLEHDSQVQVSLFPDNHAALAWVTEDVPGNPAAAGAGIDPATFPLPGWFDRRVRRALASA